ncbi:MAG: hypothetical protein LBJ88_03215 [Campylobacteraceae bacterium]|nr:hypothetical protein [Campylobacteraceae bacterium]
MKKYLLLPSLILIFILFFSGCSTKTPLFSDIIPEGSPIYNVKGFKDKRIRAAFITTFKSTANFEKDECGIYNINTNKRGARLAGQMYVAEDENYEIDIPVVINDNGNGCNYKFVGIELDLRRISSEKDIDYMYSRFMLLLDRPENDLTIYFGRKTGSGGSGYDAEVLPPFFFTNKKYFQIAPDTTFLCRTVWSEWIEKEDKSNDFHCAMEINSGDAKFYPKDKLERVVTNPQFGVETIVSSNLTINIIADDNGSIAYHGGGTGIHPDRFREYIPSKKSVFQKLFD